VICGVNGIAQYFETGRGSVKVRGKAGVEELKGAVNKSLSRKFLMA